MQDPHGEGQDSPVQRPPIPPPSVPPPQPVLPLDTAFPRVAPSGVVPVGPLGRGQEPVGARLRDGQLSGDGRYVWQRAEWVPRLPSAQQRAAPLPHLNADRYLRRPDASAQVGFRGFLHRRFGVRIGPSSEERRQRHLLSAARTSAPRPQLIAVASKKGGVGKSTLAMLLGSQFGVARKDRVLVLDSNLGSSSLAIRSAHRSSLGAVELGPCAAGVESYEQLQPYVTVMAETGLEVLPALPEAVEPTSPIEARDLAQMARRFFSVVLADLGTGVPASGWGLALADQVVVVATPSLDGALLAQSTLAQLARWRGAEWVRENAIVVMNQADIADHRVRVDAQERDLRSEVRQVFRVSWDRHLAIGGPIDWQQLDPKVRQETLRIAADLGANFIREGDQP